MPKSHKNMSVILHHAKVNQNNEINQYVRWFGCCFCRGGGACLCTFLRLKFFSQRVFGRRWNETDTATARMMFAEQQQAPRQPDCIHAHFAQFRLLCAPRYFVMIVWHANLNNRLKLVDTRNLKTDEKTKKQWTTMKWTARKKGSDTPLSYPIRYGHVVLEWQCMHRATVREWFDYTFFVFRIWCWLDAIG